MDWSLVLVSQGIETTIDYAPDGKGWALLVSPNDFDSALNAIRLYRLENRGWPWQKRVPGPEVLFDWGSLAWVSLVAFFFWLDTNNGFRSIGVMSRTAVTQGQWWRLFTAIWLHADLGHLASNAVFGFILLGLSMGRYGTGAALLAAYLAGVAGNIATGLVFTDDRAGLGASGMVMGSLGLVAAQSISLWRENPRNVKYIVSGVAGGIMLFALLGLTPGTNIVAHLGGFVVGLLLGALLTRIPATTRNWKLNLVLGLIFSLLVVLPWWLAISRAKFS